MGKPKISIISTDSSIKCCNFLNYVVDMFEIHVIDMTWRYSHVKCQTRIGPAWWTMTYHPLRGGCSSDVGHVCFNKLPTVANRSYMRPDETVGRRKMTSGSDTRLTSSHRRRSPIRLITNCLTGLFIVQLRRKLNETYCYTVHFYLQVS